ncbi:MAG: hypothetical protein ACE5D4_08160 [Thermodesulfobacteriota bacterium]
MAKAFSVASWNVEHFGALYKRTKIAGSAERRVIREVSRFAPSFIILEGPLSI